MTKPKTPFRDRFGIAVGNWWLRRVLTLECLIDLDSAYRRGLSCPGHSPERCTEGGCDAPMVDDDWFCAEHMGQVEDKVTA